MKTLIHGSLISLVLLTTGGTASAQPQHTHTATTAPTDGPIAPLLTGLSDLHHPVTTRVPRAQQFFDQGLRLFYAFNFEESARAFREAARLDPSLAMAQWGLAMALGPNLNAPMSEEDGRIAYAAAREAARLAPGASAPEQAYIGALQTRFVENGSGDRVVLDAAFASAMKAVAARVPNDPDAVTLAAAAFMQTIAWDYWLPDGSPKPGVLDTMTALEQLAARFPAHGGAHHFLIHLVEASDRYVGRAERSADLLGPLMPSAGHMVHMPSHIYIRIGRYKDAADANERAAFADEDYIAQCRAQGVYPVAYYPHNLHFLWAVGTIEGRSAVAIASARKVAAKVPHHMAGRLSWTHEFPIIPLFALVTFGQWSDILSEPNPETDTPYPAAIWHYARALARVARGELERARTELAAIERLRAHDAFKTTLAATALPLNLDIALLEVRSAIALAAGEFDAAIGAAEHAVALQDAMPYSEPALWHRPVRLQLGQALLDAGRAVDAEAVYREEIRRLPDNGWGLFGLWKSLEAQGRAADARTARVAFEKAWSRADITLESTTMMPRRPAATLTEQFVILATGVQMEYVERGNPSGVPVVFLHGVTDSWRSFEHVLPKLPDTIRAFALTARGHGDSSKPAAGYRYTDMAHDVVAFLDAKGLSRAIIVGHSMGTLVAQRLVVEHPNRVGGLVLMGAFPTLFQDAGITEFYRTALAPLVDPIDPVFAREWQLSTLARGMPADHLAIVINETRKVPARVWRDAFTGFLQTPDFSAALTQVDTPTLLLWGDKDAYVPRSAQDRLLTVLGRARLVVYDGAGHGFHWEDPGAVARDITAFVLQTAAGSYNGGTQPPCLRPLP
jgi:pimeloyl-ACP methyl ester carboxylesterase/tetratricopeptide (TPR) repeat protein